MNKSSLLIVGSIAMDTIETAVAKRDHVLGGSVTYAMIAASRYAAPHIVGIIGTDFPEEGRELYSKFAANLTDLREIECKTFSWGGRYSEDWNERQTLFTELGAFADFSPQLSSENQKVKTVLLANIHPDLQLSVMDQSMADLFIADTMNLWIETTRKHLDKVIQKTTILLVNEKEASLLTSCSEPVDAGRALLARGPEKVVVKLGDTGALLLHSDTMLRIGVFPGVTVVDPTGAGDVFAGAFSGILASGGDAVQALVSASALASICVEGFGAEKLLNCSASEIQKRIDYLQHTLGY